MFAVLSRAARRFPEFAPKAPLISAHRAFAVGAGLTESDIANNTLATLSGSGQVAPTYWLDYKTGVSHLVNLQTPQTQLTTRYADEILPDAYGFPLRVRVATKLGFKTPKWITAIEVTNTFPGGYWEDRGYNWFSGL